jgi:hypothetical protein
MADIHDIEARLAKFGLVIRDFSTETLKFELKQAKRFKDDMTSVVAPKGPQAGRQVGLSVDDVETILKMKSGLIGALKSVDRRMDPRLESFGSFVENCHLKEFPFGIQEDEPVTTTGKAQTSGEFGSAGFPTSEMSDTAPAVSNNEARDNDPAYSDAPAWLRVLAGMKKRPEKPALKKEDGSCVTMTGDPLPSGRQRK